MPSLAWHKHSQRPVTAGYTADQSQQVIPLTNHSRPHCWPVTAGHTAVCCGTMMGEEWFTNESAPTCSHLHLHVAVYQMLFSRATYINYRPSIYTAGYFHWSSSGWIPCSRAGKQTHNLCILSSLTVMWKPIWSNVIVHQATAFMACGKRSTSSCNSEK